MKIESSLAPNNFQANMKHSLSTQRCISVYTADGYKTKNMRKKFEIKIKLVMAIRYSGALTVPCSNIFLSLIKLYVKAWWFSTGKRFPTWDLEESSRPFLAPKQVSHLLIMPIIHISFKHTYAGFPWLFSGESSLSQIHKVFHQMDLGFAPWFIWFTVSSTTDLFVTLWYSCRLTLS